MFKKILSVLLVLVCVFTICCASTVNSQAIFVVDDATAIAIGISVFASVMVAMGIGFATGDGDVYTDTVSFLLYDFAPLTIRNIIENVPKAIVNGKVVAQFTSDMWNQLRNWFINTDFGGLFYNRELTINNNDFVNYQGGQFGQYNVGRNVKNPPYNTLSVQQFNSIILYNPSVNFIDLQLADGSVFRHQNLYNFTGYDSYSRVVTSLTHTGKIYFGVGINSNNQPTNDVDSVTGIGVTMNISAMEKTNDNVILGFNNSTHFFFPSGDNIYIDGVHIAQNTGGLIAYTKKCIMAGKLLSNVSNNLIPVNSNSNLDSVTTEIELDEVLPAIPGNSPVSNNESVYVPVPGSLVDPENPFVPLTKNQVKNREKEGLPVSVIPTFPVNDTTTGPELGITLNPSLDVDDDTPVYNPAYPSVINPGNETISITANDDIFPSQANPGETTVFPTEAESAIVKTGEIVSDIAKDIVTPLTPDDISKGGNRMKLPALLLQKFPFCIPYDLYNAFGVLLAEPEAPVFTVPFKSSSFGIDTSFTIDFSRYENAAKIVRWFLCVSWTVGLILLTRKVIWK